MRFFDWLDTIGLNLRLMRYNNQPGRGFSASVENAEFKKEVNDGTLASLHADGGNPEMAIRELVKLLTMYKVVVFTSYLGETPVRVRLRMPAYLEY